MSDPPIPYDPLIPCDECHAVGSFDFMGDHLCAICLAEEEGSNNISASYRGLNRLDETPTPLVYPQRSE